jgi:hypothetical protein
MGRGMVMGRGMGRRPEQRSQFLFVGNSYTSGNSLSTIFADIVRDGDIDNNNNMVYTKSVATGGGTFNQHNNDFASDDGSALTTLLAPAAKNENDWKWVVLQDQSQIPGLLQSDDYSLSYRGAIGLNNAIRAAGGRTMFFLTWGRRNGDVDNPDLYSDFLTMQGLLTVGYKRFQSATSTPQRPTYIAPIGLVFRTIYNDMINDKSSPTNDGTLFSNLYSQDGSHPSTLGSYVAALTIYSSMTGLDPTIINYWPNIIKETTARKVQDAVKRTLVNTAANGSITYPWKSMIRNRSLVLFG